MKKVIALILGLALVFSVTGCGCNDEDATDVTEAETVVEEEGFEKVILFFPDDEAQYLGEEVREVSTKDIERNIVEEVIKGPESDKYVKSIKGEVKIVDLNVENGKCTVVLSEEFMINNTGGSAAETMAIYSIVNSLCVRDNIDSVLIQIEGKNLDEYTGHYDISEPFNMDESIIER